MAPIDGWHKVFNLSALDVLILLFRPNEQEVLREVTSS